jgi:DNA topoisomerase-1
MARTVTFPARVDPTRSARSAGLSYTSDATPGIRRVRSGHGFKYLSPQGKVLRNQDDLARIRSLVIPPAWTDVRRRAS